MKNVKTIKWLNRITQEKSGWAGSSWVDEYPDTFLARDPKPSPDCPVNNTVLLRMTSDGGFMRICYSYNLNQQILKLRFQHWLRWGVEDTNVASEQCDDNFATILSIENIKILIEAALK